VVALTVMTLFVPCVANLLMIIRERGLRTGLAILAAATVIALGTGTVVNFALATFHVTF
jgi:ferrous iron transport protein B